MSEDFSTHLEQRSQIISRDNTGTATTLTAEIDDYIEQLSAIQNAAQVVRVLSHSSEASGGHVRLLPQFQYLPILIGDGNQVVPLYEFVEVVEGIIDYDSVREELPALTYPQINSAFSFLRKIAQYNPRNIDIDRVEDEQLGHDSEFIEQLRQALTEETSRVLASDE